MSGSISRTKTQPERILGAIGHHLLKKAGPRVQQGAGTINVHGDLTMENKEQPGLKKGKANHTQVSDREQEVTDNVVPLPIPNPNQTVEVKPPKKIHRRKSKMDKETQDRWNRINRAACYYFAGQAVIYGLGGIEYEEVIHTPDDEESAGWITNINTRISSSPINGNHHDLSITEQAEKMVRGKMAAKIAENLFMTRFEKDWDMDWLQEFMDEDDDENVRRYFTLLSPRKNEEEIWAFARLLSVQTEILVDENWGTIKRVAQTVYRKHRVNWMEVEALMAG